MIKTVLVGTEQVKRPEIRKKFEDALAEVVKL
jgi:hypothetical protein